MMAGSPCPVEVMKQVVDRMGMTETSPISTQTLWGSRMLHLPLTCDD